MMGEEIVLLVYSLKEIHVGDLVPSLFEVLIIGEDIKHSYKSLDSFLVFTNKRIIYYSITKEFSKSKTLSIPYRSISMFAVENTGDKSDNELVLYIAGKILRLGFNRETNLLDVCKLLSEKILK